MHDLHVIERPEAAIAALKPLRATLLAALSEPRSAAELAAELGISRQRIRYHLQALEQQGLVHEAEQRQWGGLTERKMLATASSFLLSPDTLGPVAPDPERTADRLSASYLVALGARLVREVARLILRARAANKRLATLAIDAEVRFRSPADRAAFTQALTHTVQSLVAQYHAPEGRDHRVVLVAHPSPDPEESPCPSA